MVVSDVYHKTMERVCTDPNFNTNVFRVLGWTAGSHFLVYFVLQWTGFYYIKSWHVLSSHYRFLGFLVYMQEVDHTMHNFKEQDGVLKHKKYHKKTDIEAQETPYPE